MSEHYLGVPFDIHGGGLDLIFPHHENEIAQSCCAHKIDRMARYWVHNGFLEMRGEKMAKSLGNVIRLPEALGVVPGEALRLLLMMTHYRQPADYTPEAALDAKHTLDRFYAAVERLENVEAEMLIRGGRIEDALLDDLNTPAALSELHSLLSDANIAHTTSEKARAKGALLAGAELLGILQNDSHIWLRGGVSDPAIERQIVARAAARRAREFARADQIRAELLVKGIILEDTPSGTTWRRA